MFIDCLSCIFVILLNKFNQFNQSIMYVYCTYDEYNAVRIVTGTRKNVRRIVHDPNILLTRIVVVMFGFTSF